MFSESRTGHIQQGHFSDTTKYVLFAQGHPTRAYKDAIELATRRFKLRHVFGVEDMQHWFDTVYLQFGFTRRGFIGRLPEWLTSQVQTQAVQLLLQGKVSSPSFRELWQSLLEYRRESITQQQLRKRLSYNPWILPEWIEDLVRQASAKPHLGSGERGNSPNTRAEEEIERFLDNPVLRWDPPSPPQFICHVSNLVNLDLEESTYKLVIAGHCCWQLFRKIDGSYKVEPSDEIVLPVLAPSLVANLVTEDRRVVHSMTLQLWDEYEDVTAFRPSTGDRFDPCKHATSSETAIILLIAPHLTVEPQPVQWYDLGKAKLYLLSRGWSPQTSVLWQGELYWRSDLASQSNISRQAIKDAIQVSIYEAPRKLQFGEKIRLSITFPCDVELVFIRSGGKSIGFALQVAMRAITEPITLQPCLFAHEGNNKLEVQLVVKSQSRIVPIRSTVDLHIIGAAMRTTDNWAVLDTSSTITVEQGKTQSVKYFLVDTEKWVLLEGDTRVESAQVKKLARPIGSGLTGFGASLTIQKGSAYNVQLNESYALAKEVVDYGIIADVVIDPIEMAARTLSVRISYPIELDEHYIVVWWDKCGSFHKFDLECDELQENDMWWLAAIPQELTEPLMFAIAYDGVRLGTWWDANWSRILQNMPANEPLMTAAMLRWFHLPLLSNSFRSDVQQFAYGYPAEVLAAWIEEVGILKDLRHSDSSEGWLSVIRTTFGQWQPDAATTQSVISWPGGDPAESPWDEVLINIVWKLIRVSPLLMGRVIQRWIEEICIPKWGLHETGALLRILLFEVAGVTTNEALLRKKEAIKEDVAKMMHGVDSDFIEKALIQRAITILQGQAVSIIDEHNIAAALNKGAFRHLLSMRILEKIVQNITNRR